jgi:hypothetical protein
MLEHYLARLSYILHPKDALFLLMIEISVRQKNFLLYMSTNIKLYL